ncbi:MAG: hypothetical protein E7168_03440 [Firmicutes bacterium]|nr:hypothetical protein [Bacillota bacterium]
MDIKTTIFNKIFNMDKRKLGITIIVLLVTILILFPFIDTNFFYSNRIKNRIDILQKITELDMDKISQDENLLKEYESIVKEINESDNNYINKVLNNNKDDNTIGKFISGGILWWILGIVMLFFYNIFNKDDKNGKNWGTRIAGFILCLIIGGLIGLICSIVPTIFNIWVNYIIIPILVLILMILLLYKTTSNN